jgi:hypothetical protein
MEKIERPDCIHCRCLTVYFASQWVLPEKGLDESSWLLLTIYILSLRYTYFQSSGRLHSTFSFCSEKRCTQWSLCALASLSWLKFDVQDPFKICDNSWNFEASKLFSLNGAAVEVWVLFEIHFVGASEPAAPTSAGCRMDGWMDGWCTRTHFSSDSCFTLSHGD